MQRLTQLITYILLTASLGLAVLLPSPADAQFDGLFGGSSFNNNGQQINRIRQISGQAVARIRFLTYHKNDVADVISQIQITRSSAISSITDLVNSFKAANEQSLNAGSDQRVASDQRSQIRTAIFQVETAAQQAVDEIDVVTNQVAALPNQATILPQTNQLPFFRSNLPSQYGPLLYGQLPQPAPRLTQYYAQTGAQPFIPISSSQGYQYYHYPYPGQPTVQQKGFNWGTLGTIIGAYLGLKGGVKGQPANQATVKVMKFSPNDAKNYTFRLAGAQSQIAEQAVPGFIQQAIVSRVVPGNYQAYYSGTDLPATNYAVIISPNETWCFSVPQPPVRCQ